MKKLALGALLSGLIACGGGNTTPPILIDAPDTAACNPIAQTGCAANDKCTWIIDLVGDPTTGTADIGHIGCAPTDGTEAGVDESCLDAGDPGGPPAGANGFDNCAKGLICIARVCQTICDPQEIGAASGCDTEHECGSYNGLFETGDVTVAGACDALCNIFDQKLVSDGREACGSTNPETGNPDPGHPNRGCYPNAAFKTGSCAPVRRDDSPNNVAGQPLHNNRIGGIVPLTNSAGQAFKNGCAPGYTPLYFESDTVNTAMCTGICAAQIANSAIADGTDNAGLGKTTTVAKLPRSTMAVAGDATCAANKKGDTVGASNVCVFMYGLSTDAGVVDPEIGPEGEEFGFCFPFSKYQMESPPGTPVAYPNPASLPPRSGGTPGTVELGTLDDTADLLLEPRFRATTATRAEAGVPLPFGKKAGTPSPKTSLRLGTNAPRTLR
jgi:hypothetical protein